MGRSRASAKKAGTAFETLVAGYLAENYDDRVERRARNGDKDRGDVSGVRLSPALGGGRIVIECKNTARMDLAGWVRETSVERGNDDATVGVVVHKRHGNGKPEDQWVTCTLADFVALLVGSRPDSNM